MNRERKYFKEIGAWKVAFARRIYVEIWRCLGDRPRKIEKVVEDLIGKEKASHFWKTCRQNYITEADIKRISELGFNSVRSALSSRFFLTKGENPVYFEEGFQLIDSLVSWCMKYKIYVIIDMHGVPCGLTGANID